MKKAAFLFLVLGLNSVAVASDFNVSIQSNGSSYAAVTSGSTITYNIIGELSDNQNEGLAMFSLDLSYSGGAMTAAANPNSMPMLNFAKPLGMNNPAGFGGTLQNGRLIQVGGGQNTLNNFFAPYPNGNVVTGVAHPGQSVVLATGTITAPTQPGTYYLKAHNIFANVIKQGETGETYWKVEAADVGEVTDLKIDVISLTQNKQQVSMGDNVIFEINAGPAHAGRTYWLLGSVSGTTPGTALPGDLTLPLNFDWYFLLTRLQPNSDILQYSLGRLDSQGRARARFVPSKDFLGMTASHAFILLDPVNFVSNPVSVQVVQ